MTTSSTPVAFITGAGSGIGRAIAIQLAAHQFRLALVGRRLDALEETGQIITEASSTGDSPSSWIAISADITDPDQIADAITATDERFSRLDVLINNAGFAPLATPDESDPELIRVVFEINALAPTWAVAAVWPIFQRQGSGCVVNISSMATQDPFPGLFAYAAAKGSVNVLAKACVASGQVFTESGGSGVRAFAIAPGAVETDMLRSILTEDQLPKDATLSPEAVAEVVCQCVLGKCDDQIGQTIPIPSPALK